MTIIIYITCSEPETQVLDYQTQQFKLLPLLATTYGFNFTGKFMKSLYDKAADKIASGVFTHMAEVLSQLLYL